MPKEIVIRLVMGHVLHIEHDGERVATCDLDPGVEDDRDDAQTSDGQVPVKAIEVALTALGYVPDLGKMYMDSDLLVLKFHGVAPPN